MHISRHTWPELSPSFAVSAEAQFSCLPFPSGSGISISRWFSIPGRKDLSEEPLSPSEHYFQPNTGPADHVNVEGLMTLRWGLMALLQRPWRSWAPDRRLQRPPPPGPRDPRLPRNGRLLRRPEVITHRLCPCPEEVTGAPCPAASSIAHTDNTPPLCASRLALVGSRPLECDSCDSGSSLVTCVTHATWRGGDLASSRPTLPPSSPQRSEIAPPLFPPLPSNHKQTRRHKHAWRGVGRGAGRRFLCFVCAAPDGAADLR